MKTQTRQKLLVGVIIGQGLLIAGLWAGQPAAQAAGRGDMVLPDPGARQIQMVDELKALNAKVDRLTAVLTEGEIKVKVAKDEK